MIAISAGCARAAAPAPIARCRSPSPMPTVTFGTIRLDRIKFQVLPGIMFIKKMQDEKTKY